MADPFDAGYSFEGMSAEAAFEAGWDKAARRFEPHKARAEAAEARVAELEAALGVIVEIQDRADAQSRRNQQGVTFLASAKRMADVARVALKGDGAR